VISIVLNTLEMVRIKFHIQIDYDEHQLTDEKLNLNQAP